jgi:pimeloyl-ACP methyl ester carboxylesterase
MSDASVPGAGNGTAAGHGHRAITHVEVAGHRLETLDLPATRARRPPLLLLHEGLGSVSQWRDFPLRLAAATGCRTVAYSRLGHGRSTPLPAAHDPRFMHREALETLPALRAALGLQRPLLIGHSTGASMALIHAGADRWPVAGVAAMAPLCFVEESNLDSIRRMREIFRDTDLAARMARHHADPARVFWSWNDIWLDPAFAGWSIVEDLAGIRCRILAILGTDDEYSSSRQIEAIVRHAVRSMGVQVQRLEQCGHAPQKDQPERVLELLARFVDACAAPPAPDARPR